MLRIQILVRNTKGGFEDDAAKDIEVNEVVDGVATICHFRTEDNSVERLMSNVNMTIANMYLPKGHEIQIRISKTKIPAMTKVWIMLEV